MGNYVYNILNGVRILEVGSLLWPLGTTKLLRRGSEPDPRPPPVPPAPERNFGGKEALTGMSLMDTEKDQDESSEVRVAKQASTLMSLLVKQGDNNSMSKRLPEASQSIW